MRKQLLLILALMGLWACSDGTVEYRDLNKNGVMDAYENPGLSIEDRVDDLLKRLSLEEKVSLVVGQGFYIPGISDVVIEERVPGAAGNTHPVDSLGIPVIVLSDGPAGLRIQPIRDSTSEKRYYATAFPIASNLASTWDVALVNEVGKAMGQEVKEYGVDVLLAPGMNVHRNPLAGRNFEYYSEDPLLSGKMSAAFVNGVESNDVGTSIKHFAANNQETNRMMVDTRVSERALREIYLRGFEISVKEAQPWTVMSAYNKINGVYASENGDLLNKVLRDDWGFEGLVVTDWFAGDNVVEQMKAGNDLIMPGGAAQQQALIAAVQSGELDESILNTNVKRVLKLVFQSPAFLGYPYSDNPALDEHAALVRKVSAEGTVLLKNENDALPLKGQDLKVAAYGIGSYDFIAGGTGSGDVNEAYTISLVAGLENAGIPVNEKLKSSYETYVAAERAKQPPRRGMAGFGPAIPLNEMPLTNARVKQFESESDLALITIGRSSGEFADRKTAGDYYLTDAEQQMITAVSQVYHAQGKPVIVLLNIGNVIETKSWRDKADAIVLGWQGGQEAGNALTDVITGKVNPSGKLPTTFSVAYEDVPSADNFPGEELPAVETEEGGGFMSAMRGKPAKVTYEEGIYVGYRYFSTFDKEVAYPFGFGLSYTSFEYADLSLGSTEFSGEMSIKVKISNTGDISGREVVQLYVSAPGKAMDKPAMELRAFAKTSELGAGESEEISLSLDARSLSSFDSQRNAWVVEPGVYELRVGSSITDIRQTADFTVAEEISVEQVTDALNPRVAIKELKSNNN
jgi:beta-glucosidase